MLYSLFLCACFIYSACMARIVSWAISVRLADDYRKWMSWVALYFQCGEQLRRLFPSRFYGFFPTWNNFILLKGMPSIIISNLYIRDCLQMNFYFYHYNFSKDGILKSSHWLSYLPVSSTCLSHSPPFLLPPAPTLPWVCLCLWQLPVRALFYSHWWLS